MVSMTARMSAPGTRLVVWALAAATPRESRASPSSVSLSTSDQGLSLVHFSAQLERFV